MSRRAVTRVCRVRTPFDGVSPIPPAIPSLASLLSTPQQSTEEQLRTLISSVDQTRELLIHNERLHRIYKSRLTLSREKQQKVMRKIQQEPQDEALIKLAKSFVQDAGPTFYVPSVQT